MAITATIIKPEAPTREQYTQWDPQKGFVVDTAGLSSAMAAYQTAMAAYNTQVGAGYSTDTGATQAGLDREARLAELNKTQTFQAAWTKGSNQVVNPTMPKND